MESPAEQLPSSARARLERTRSTGGLFIAFWLLGCAAWATAMLAVSAYDLQVSLAVYRPNSRFADVVRYFGELPGVALALFSAVLWLRARQETAEPRPHLPLYATIVSYCLLYPVLAVQTIKALWGRVRFYRLPADLSGFTPFYVAAGVGAGRSFPSGHAAVGSVPIAFPLYHLLTGRYRWLLVSGPLATAFQLAVAWGRIVAGRHYVTDVLFSVGIGWLLNALLLRLFLKRKASKNA
jgi:membrane-associated phospholipid phosphatase